MYKYIDIRLALGFFLWKTLPKLFGDEIVPFIFANLTPAHRRLPCPQLRNGLQLLDGLNCLLQKLSIRIPLCSLVADSLEDDGIFL